MDSYIGGEYFFLAHILSPFENACADLLCRLDRVKTYINQYSKGSFCRNRITIGLDRQ